jgi:hypothetical protein
MKAEHRMGRNYLWYRQGDAINAVLAAVGYNFSLLLMWLRLLWLRTGDVHRPPSARRRLKNGNLHGRLLKLTFGKKARCYDYSISENSKLIHVKCNAHIECGSPSERLLRGPSVRTMLIASGLSPDRVQGYCTLVQVCDRMVG